ncbi:tyrosine-type recombinase/integrase [Methylocystis sp.]|uniref:tyrosine-type recombinase/integrase n=1 Tax=Methylocystis sp. TaxID=1911079 RepID=UPI0025E266F0|nr:tyrosine-type recombinase/integrase [Methylocystis sp.]
MESVSHSSPSGNKTPNQEATQEKRQESASTVSEVQSRATLEHPDASENGCNETQLTFDEVCSLYEEAAGNLSGYERLLATFGHMPLDDITQEVIDRVAERLHPNGKASTIRRNYFTRIRAIFNFAADKGLCERRKIAAPPTERQPQKVPTLHPRDANRIIRACDERFRPLFICLLLSGGHAQECLSLCWEQIDFVRKEIRFPKTKSTAKRQVPIHPLLFEALLHLPRREGAVFLRPNGEPYKERRNAGASIRHVFAEARNGAGLKNLRVRDLHSIWATLELARNRNVPQLAYRGGWADGASLPLYERMSPAELDELRDAHDRWLLPPLATEEDQQHSEKPHALAENSPPKRKSESRREDARPLPRLLRREEAAHYCALSVEYFLRLCPVPPIKLGNSKRLERYDIKALDAWLDNPAGGGTSSGGSEWLGRVEKPRGRRPR